MPSPSLPLGTLLIGYGSSIRGDDAAGLKVAEAMQARNVDGVKVIACHLLTPELAEPVSEAARAIFADAAVDVPRGQVRVSRLEPKGNHQVMVHSASPNGVLQLAQSVFGHSPEAWLISIGVTEEDMVIGEGLTPAAMQGVQLAVRAVETLLGENETCRS